MNYDFVVIGAGISGLVAASRFQCLGKNGVVLEVSSKLGGCIETVNFDNYFLELGAHSCFNSYSSFLEVIKSLSEKTNIKQLTKPPFLLKNDNGLNLIQRSLNIPTLLLSLTNVLFNNKSNKTVAEYYTKIVGDKNYQTVVKYALSAVSCQNVDDMPAKFLFQKRKKVKKTPHKFSEKRGLGQFVKAIARDLNVKTNCKVTNINIQDGLWQITFNKHVVTSKKLIIATPPNVACELLQSSNLEVSQLLSKFDTTTFLSAAVVLDRAEFKKCAGWIGAEQEFYSMVSADVVNSNLDKRGFSFHFKPNSLQANDFKQWLQDSLQIEENKIKKIWYKENTLPIITQGHYQKVDQLQKSLPANLALVGNYFNGMSIEDCSRRADSEVSRIN